MKIVNINTDNQSADLYALQMQIMFYDDMIKNTHYFSAHFCVFWHFSIF